MRQVVIGMAGHIDHGKTSIIKSLTGTQTERYSEEIERGLTIDIGFAFLNDNISLIDVPGHEKFIKNMLTGSYSIDFAILVIAANDGIMPQTIEHFDILKLLGVKYGLVVLNKIDLVDHDWTELLIEDIQDMTKKTFLEDCKIIKTSAIKNIGIKELNDEIVNSCKNIPFQYDRDFFRMAIDRAFTIKGYGTVATGTVTSGNISIGDIVEVLPNLKQYKIRGIQSQEKSIETVGIGYRAAINVGNLDVKDIKRGCQISSPGYLNKMNKIIVRCTLLEKLKKPLKQNQRVRVHIGTNESIGRVSLGGSNELQPGDSCVLLIKLESQVIATMGDKFILRTFSPLITIGGGIVITDVANLSWKQIKSYIKDIDNLKSTQIKKYIIEIQRFKPLSYQDSKIKFGLGDAQIENFIKSVDDIFSIKYKSKRWVFSTNQLANCKKELLKFLKSNQDKYDLGFSKSLILQNTNGDEKFIDFLLDSLEEKNEIYKKDEKWIIKGEKITLNDSDQLLKNNLINILDKEGFVTSSLDKLSEINNCNKEKLKKILNVLEKNDEIIRVNETLMFSNSNLNNLKKDLIHFFSSNEILSMRDFKELTHTSRKYAVPLLEYLDKIKFTFRVPDGRKLIK